jgi:hypothetical protein
MKQPIFAICISHTMAGLMLRVPEVAHVLGAGVNYFAE